MKNKRLLISILAVIGLISIALGTTVAFFNYAKTGTGNILAVGRINFNSSQGTSINLTNVFPVKREELNDSNEVGSVTLTVTGDTTYDDGIEYLISADNVVNTVNSKEVPIGVVVTANNLGTSDDSYFTNRGGNSSIYKILSKDTIKEDGELVVGYITKGATGVNGTVTIKAFIDGDRVVITDTPEENSDWQAGREVLSTEEWNSLNTNGLSFKIKVEANQGIWVKEPPTALNTIKKNVITPATPINFGKVSSDTNGKGLYILPGTESDANPIYYYRGAVDNNNVIFGGFCWLMVRTTETGGIKMVYNGAVTGTTENPTCENATGAARQISTSAFNTNYTSMSDVGYMYNTRYVRSSGAAASGSIFGKNVEWNGTSYLVIEDTSGTASTNTTLDANHHYTCGSASTTTCTSVKYYFYNSGSDYRYITLTGGDTIEDALYKMTGNGSTETKTKNSGYALNITSSTAKTNIENWFKTNLTNEEDASKTNYQEYLEDTTWCNDRSYSVTPGKGTYEEAGWNPSGGSLTTYQYFAAGGRRWIGNHYSSTNVPVMTCPNVTDQFRIGNVQAKLNYPVGLLTADEIIMAGSAGNSTTNNSSYYLYNGSNYDWSLSPSSFDYSGAVGFTVYYGYISGNYVDYSSGLRPSVSLKPGTEFLDGGEGTKTKPYMVKIEE